MNEGEIFKLQESEKIVKSIKPQKGLLWYFLIGGYGGKGREYSGNIISSLITIIIFFYFFLSFSRFTSYSLFFTPFFLIITFFVVFAFAIVVLIAYLRYKKQYYWITNKRVIYKRGFIGYRISSIPLERISDIIISRTFLERIFGFGSIAIQSMAGQVSRGRLGEEASLLAVPNPEETQELIFDLIKKKRKEEHITM